MEGRNRLIVLCIIILLAAGFFVGTTDRACADNGVSPTLEPWVDELPIPPVATPTSTMLGDYYEIKMVASQHQFHGDLPPPAGVNNIWTYVQTGSTPVHLGPTIVARTNRPVTIQWVNELPTDPDLFPLKDSIDPTIMGSDLPSGRAIPHLHGGHSAARFDGTPHQWWTADGQTGPGYVTDKFIYVNDQPASLTWYHDHAWGVTRMNPYLGLAAAYLIIDNVDNGTTILNQKVPAGYGKYHIPLVLQDKTFNDDGTLWYPTEGLTPTHPIWVPEFFADTPVVNGKAYPYFNAQPRRYRFRMLNGSQARFYNVHFHVEGGVDLPFWVIGSEGGLLPKPASMTALKIAPGERFDVIADFTGLALGSIVTLTNDNPAPDPDGEDPILPELLQIRVNTPVPADDPDLTKPPALLKLPASPRLIPTRGLPVRDVVLKENFYEGPADDDFPDAIGSPIEVLLNGYYFTDPTTDFIKRGTTETWQWINLTGDTHPMHPHLVTFQTLNRQAFRVEGPLGYDTAWQAYLDSDVGLGRDPLLKPNIDNYLIDGVLPPAPEEMGYKDTIKAPPGYVTRTRAKFTLPWTALLDFNWQTKSFGSWVYHCHILEHEENDMMRPFEVVW